MTDEGASSTTSDSLIDEVHRRSGVSVVCTMSGRRTTTFCIGGEYRFFLEPNSESELISVVKVLQSLGQTYRVLGAGSNLLVSDSGTSDWVIRLGRGFRSLDTMGEGRFRVGGSMPLMTLSRDLSDAGFAGLEFAGGIPASLGGAVRMNAGAHGTEMSSIITRVRFLSLAGSIEDVSIKDLSFSYRHSSFNNGSVVIGAQIALVSSDPALVKQTRANHLAERKKRQPLSYPSAGSVFKNPASSKFSAGALIEQAGLKGFRVGGAEISSLHGNWIINPSKTALAEDVLSLISHCQSVVFEKTGISLEPEVVTWR